VRNLGELGDVAGEGVQVRAAFAGAGELFLLVVAEADRVGEDPAGEVAALVATTPRSDTGLIRRGGNHRRFVFRACKQ